MKTTLKYGLFLVLFTFVNSIFGQNARQGQQLSITPLINGTLLQPDGIENAPMVIIIGGSGPTDRDGNQAMMKNDMLKKLAQGFQENAIASFRYDKRIFSLMQKGTIDEREISFDDFVADAVAVVDYFNTKGFSNISIVGHSQGALVGVIAAQQAPVNRLVSLEGAGQSIDNIILDQLGQQAPFLKAEAQETMQAIKKGDTVNEVSPALNSFLRPSIQNFMHSWMVYNPAEELKKLNIPSLIITGSKDLQVAPSEGEILKQSVPNAQLVSIENMNHVLREVTSDTLENAKTYNESNRPIMPEVVSLISDFIKSDQ